MVGGGQPETGSAQRDCVRQRVEAPEATGQGAIALIELRCAGMAELADAADSKSADRKVVGVRPPLPALFNYFIINNLQDSMVSCPCGVRMGRCLIVAHLHSGKPSDAGPIQSRLMGVC